MVPNSWGFRRLEDVAKVVSGGTPSKRNEKYWIDGHIPWLRTTEVQNCVLQPQDTQVFITQLGLENSSAKLFPKGTVLMAMIGQGKTRGQVALLDFKASTNQNCAAIIFNEEQYPEYYFNYLQSQYENIRNYSNSAGQSNLSGGLVKSIQVPVPPLLEQQKIAKILSTWDKAISTTEKLIATRHQQKKALMQQLLTGKKRLINPETGKAFAGEWEEVQLGKLATKVGSGVTPKGGSSAYKASGTPLIRSQNVLWGKLDLSDVVYIDDMQHEKMKNSKVTRNDVLLNITGASIGRVSLASLSEANVNQHVCIIRCSKNIYPAYLKFFLLSFQGQKQIELCQAGGNRQGLNFAQIKLFKVQLPSSEEQQKIASVLTTADKEIEVLEAKLTHFRLEKKALMQQLLTGKRRVQVNEE